MTSPNCGSERKRNINMYHHGIQKMYKTIDYKVWVWSHNLQKEKGEKRVTKKEVQGYARELSKSAGMSGFKASDGWYRRWLNRWNQRITKGAHSQVSAAATNSRRAESTGPRNSSFDCDQQTSIAEKESSASTEINHDISNMRNLNIVSQIDKNTHTSKKIAQNTEGGAKSHSDNNYKKNDTEKIESKQNFPTCHITNVCNDSEEQQTSRQHVLYQECQNVRNSEYCLKTVPARMQSKEVFVNCSLHKCRCAFCDTNVSENSKVYKSLSTEKIATIRVNVDLCNDELNSGRSNEKLSDKGLKVMSENRYVSVSKNVKKGERYLPSFKRKVMLYAVDNTIKAAAEKYKVNRGTVAEWLKENRKTIEGRSLIDRKEKQSQKIKFAENSFLVWLKNCIELNQNLSKDNIASKIYELLKCCKIDSKYRASSWLLAYSDRLNAQEKIGKLLYRNKHLMYPIEFKLQVVRYSQMNSQKKAACVFAVARKRVYEWLLQVKNKELMVKKERNPLAYVLDSQIDQQIWNWYKLQKNNPTGKQIREIGQQFYRAGGYRNMKCSHSWYYKWRERVGLPPVRSNTISQDSLLLEWILTQFDNNKTLSHRSVLDEALKLQCCRTSKGSLGWTLRFCKKYSHLLQHVPDISTHLPSVMETKVENYRKELWRTVWENKLSLEHIVAMDEIPLHFSSAYTDKKSLLRQPGFHCCQGTVMLASLANGTLLPAMLVLKDGGDPVIENQRNSILLTVYSQDGCVDPTIMLVWVQSVVLQCLKSGSILINDCYQPHLDYEVAEKLHKHKIKQLTIPGGCTSKLQPLNSIVQKLQNSVQEEWKNVMRANSFSSHLKSPGFQEVHDWVSKSLVALACTEKVNLQNCFRQMRLIP